MSRHMCDLCGIDFDELNAYLRHVNVQHSKVPCTALRLTECKKYFDGKTVLKAHFDGEHGQTIGLSWCRKRGCAAPIHKDGTRHACIYLPAPAPAHDDDAGGVAAVVGARAW